MDFEKNLMDMLRQASPDANTEELFNTEVYNFRVLQNLDPIFEKNSYREYIKVAGQLRDAATLEIKPELAEEAKNLREKLVQVEPCSKRMWRLWGDTAAKSDSDPIVEEDFNLFRWDNPDFKPFIIPYLLEDQSAVKGNVIVIAGGGYAARANQYEGYPTAERFNALGYNSYVLHRRVAPYSQRDIWMDMQRAVRNVRYHGKQLALGGMDLIAAAGFSGGGSTILGQIDRCYGYKQPQDLYDSDYVPDDIDRENSDLDVAMIIYGPMYNYELQKKSEWTGATDGVFVTDNPNLPAFFIVAGQNDRFDAQKTSLELYLSVLERTPTEMHLFREARHGFGVGYGLSEDFKDNETENIKAWPDLADTFMDIQTGRLINIKDL